MHKKILFFAIVGLVLKFMAQPAQSQPTLFAEPLSPRIANYDIEVRLDTDKRMLFGKEVLTWYNKSSDPITELQFHLYLNAFRNNQSTFLKESGGSSRGNRIDKDGWGFIDIDHLGIVNGADLTDMLEFIQPDDDNAEDKTVFRVPLAKPLRPGESIKLNIDFTAKLPKPPFARTGARAEYFFVGQWFPKIGVYIDGKWNCHQFHANSEFFADFGVYNVRMTVPENNIVGATGLEYEVKKNGDGTVTHAYHAEDVHDFAWTTSPDFVEFTGKTKGGVDIRVLMQKDHVDQGQRHIDAAIVAVDHFEDWYGDYPFPNLTVVDPRRGAGGSGGMEYPTLITAGTSYGIPAGVRIVEFVIIHEFGHNFWYHLLASNEFEESWMDEGINTYTEIQIMTDAYGPTGDAIDFLGIKLNDLQFQRGQYLFFPDVDPMIRTAWGYYDNASYGINSYSKPGVVLTTLQNYLGKETLQKIMRTYVARWRFRHPKTRDFIAVANEVAGQDLSWFFDQAFFNNAVLDYSVDRVFATEVKKAEGYDFTMSRKDSAAAMTDTTPDSNATMAAKDSAETMPDSAKGDKETAKQPKVYRNGASIRRLGTFTFPVEVELKFADGETIRESWDGKELWKKLEYTKPTKLVSATVDPDHKIVLDVNFTNNSRSVERHSLGINKLSARWLFWMQFLLDQPNFLGLLSRLN